MKLLKLKKYLLLISCLFALQSCNKHNKNTSIVPDSGPKNPIQHQPVHKNDTSKIKPSGEISNNYEYDQHRIDSIKNSKTKPPHRKNGKGEK